MRGSSSSTQHNLITNHATAMCTQENLRRLSGFRMRVCVSTIFALLFLLGTQKQAGAQDSAVVADAPTAVEQVTEIIERPVTAASDDAEEEMADGTTNWTNGDLELGQVSPTRPQYVGLRFTQVNVPPGVTIVNAYVRFTADPDTEPANASDLTIRGEAVDNATTFVTTTFNISTRITTTASVRWQPLDWLVGNESGPAQTTSDISSIIQEIVDRPGWNSNNALVLIITGTGTRRALPYSLTTAASAPLLHIEYTTGAPNTAPVAANDTYSADQDTALNIAAPGVLGNDTDADSDTLTAVKVSDPANGTLTLNPDGSFVYTPNAGYTGLDSFTYKANDGTADSNIVTVTITVSSEPNSAPVAANNAYTIAQDTALNVAVPGVLGNDTDADSDTLTAIKVSDPTHGTLALNANGSFVYTPTANFNGVDSFTYKANDGTADSAVATVTITVTSESNSAPVAVNDTYSADQDTALNIAAPGVLDNDTDADSETLTAIKVRDPANGTLTLSANGSFVYTPTNGYSGPDSFTYKANDGSADSNVATVTITVEESGATDDEMLFLPRLERQQD